MSLLKAVAAHGYNVSDDGRTTIGRLLRYLPWECFMFLYGKLSLLGVRAANGNIAKLLAEQYGDLDIAIGHSNGCALIALALRDYGAKWKVVVLLNPALDYDWEFPPGVKVICLYSKWDLVVWLASKMIKTIWGGAGRKGLKFYQIKSFNWARVLGRKFIRHSTAFKYPQAASRFIVTAVNDEIKGTNSMDYEYFL